VEIKPTAKAFLGEISFLAFSIIVSLASLVIPTEQGTLWYILPVSLIVASFFISKRTFLLTLVALVPGTIGFYFSRALALISLPIALIELYLLAKYISSIRYLIREDGVTISVDFVLMSTTRTIPKDSISEIQVNTGPLGKLLGYAQIGIKLKGKGEIKIDGVPKGAADEVKRMLLK
jgi:membrane protein YdbS with pleckstrin-like domain